METTEGSETSAIINQTPGNYSKGNLLYSVQGESLKSSLQSLVTVNQYDTATHHSDRPIFITQSHYFI